MKLQGAVIKEQGVTFAIVVVKERVLLSESEKEAAIKSYAPLFPGMPLVLMAQDSQGIPRYFGRKDIVRFLARLQMSQIPWQTYTVK